MTGGYVLTSSACTEIDEIAAYLLEHGGINAASHVLNSFEEAFSIIADQPGIGHTRDDFSDGNDIRVWRVFSYLVIYRADTRPVEILRVIHGRETCDRSSIILSKLLLLMVSH